MEHHSGNRNKINTKIYICVPVILICANLSIPGFATAQSMCSYETIGTTVPNTSGTPVVISPLTGTVIAANFFDSGAIDPPYFDGMEFVSVCVDAPDQNGNSTAVITTDVGLDDDTRIKAYPQFAILSLIHI